MAGFCWLCVCVCVCVCFLQFCGSLQQFGVICESVSVCNKWGFFATVSLIVQERCESRGGRPGLAVLTSLLVSMDVKNY